MRDLGPTHRKKLSVDHPWFVFSSLVLSEVFPSFSLYFPVSGNTLLCSSRSPLFLLKVHSYVYMGGERDSHYILQYQDMGYLQQLQLVGFLLPSLFVIISENVDPLFRSSMLGMHLSLKVNTYGTYIACKTSIVLLVFHWDQDPNSVSITYQIRHQRTSIKHG